MTRIVLLRLIGSVINLLDNVSLETRPDFSVGFARWAEHVEDFSSARAGLEAMHDVPRRAPKIAFLNRVIHTILDPDPTTLQELNTVIEEQINRIETVTGVRTTIVLKTIEEMPPMSGHDLSKEI